jgi:hypothetical protein
MNKKESIIFDYLKLLVFKSKKIFTLDVDMDNRTSKFITHFGPSLNFTNNIINHNKRLITKYNKFDDLEKNKKIVICCY